MDAWERAWCGGRYCMRWEEEGGGWGGDLCVEVVLGTENSEASNSFSQVVPKGKKDPSVPTS